MLVTFKSQGALLGAKHTNGSLDNRGVRVDGPAQTVYVCGVADSNMQTVKAGNFYFAKCKGIWNAFLSAHSFNLNTYHQTFLGGSNTDYGIDLYFGRNGILYMLGATNSTDFPIVTPQGAYSQTVALTTLDNFVTAFLPGDTTLKWSTCLGSLYDETQSGNSGIGMAIDGRGIICSLAELRILPQGTQSSPLWSL